MTKRIDELLIEANQRLYNFMEDFKEEEKGASDMVAVIVLIVVVIAIAAVFRTQLTNAVTAVFDKLTNFING